MSANLIFLLLVTAAFAVLTGIALIDVGYLGILEPHFQAWGTAQVFFDLVILAGLSCIWMLKDARSRGSHVPPRGKNHRPRSRQARLKDSRHRPR